MLPSVLAAVLAVVWVKPADVAIRDKNPVLADSIKLASKEARCPCSVVCRSVVLFP